jgi:predicted RNA-binding Zn-ribbon protein involved in translation (DUF1610 family)
MISLPHHEHECPDCGNSTVHHVHDHEQKGDEVKFWCRHCEKDVTGTIGEFVV